MDKWGNGGTGRILLLVISRGWIWLRQSDVRAWGPERKLYFHSVYLLRRHHAESNDQDVFCAATGLSAIGCGTGETQSWRLAHLGWCLWNECTRPQIPFFLYRGIFGTECCLSVQGGDATSLYGMPPSVTVQRCHNSIGCILYAVPFIPRTSSFYPWKPRPHAPLYPCCPSPTPLPSGSHRVDLCAHTSPETRSAEKKEKKTQSGRNGLKFRKTLGSGAFELAYKEAGVDNVLSAFQPVK